MSSRNAVLEHPPIYGLGDLGLVPRGEAGRFTGERNTARGGGLPLNTNGGSLSCMHSGMYALQESLRQMRGTAPAEVPDPKISVCHGVGGMWCSRSLELSRSASTLTHCHSRRRQDYRRRRQD
jgi:acetyl-CoA acetyltransferase